MWYQSTWRPHSDNGLSVPDIVRLFRWFAHRDSSNYMYTHQCRFSKQQLQPLMSISLKMLQHIPRNMFTLSWWRHQMETVLALLALCEGSPLTKASDGELWCFLRSAPEQTVAQRNWNAGDLRRHRGHHYITVIIALNNILLKVRYRLIEPISFGIYETTNDNNIYT